MNLHGGSNSGVVNLNSTYLMPDDQLSPLCVDERGIVKDGENWIEPVQPIFSLIGCQAESVLIRWTSAYIPEFGDILRQNTHWFVGGKKEFDGP